MCGLYKRSESYQRVTYWSHRGHPKFWTRRRNISGGYRATSLNEVNAAPLAETEIRVIDAVTNCVLQPTDTSTPKAQETADLMGDTCDTTTAARPFRR